MPHVTILHLPHPTPYLPHARALSSIAFNLIFDPNFKDFSGFFTLFKAKISLILHLNAGVERNYRDGIGNFGGEIERVLEVGGVEGGGTVGVGRWQSVGRRGKSNGVWVAECLSVGASRRGGSWSLEEWGGC